jgi:hypothetical protein
MSDGPDRHGLALWRPALGPCRNGQWALAAHGCHQRVDYIVGRASPMPAAACSAVPVGHRQLNFAAAQALTDHYPMHRSAGVVVFTLYTVTAGTALPPTETCRVRHQHPYTS